MSESIRVLHVDDDPQLAETVAAVLESLDERFDVDVATGASAGLERFTDGEYDCVVSDYTMPERSGVELLEDVRAVDPDCPFILYTGQGSEAVASEAISAGVTDYLQKGGGTSHYELLANRIENAVERSHQKQRLETLIDNLPGMVYRCRNEHGWPMTDVRGEVEALTGYAAAELEGGDGVYGSDVVHPDDREDVWRAVQDAVDAGEAYELTYRIVAYDGTQKWVWERGQPVSTPGGDGDPEMLEGFVTDVTERERARRELSAEREFVRQALDALDDLFYVVDPDGDLRRWNARVPEVTGYDAADLREMTAADLFPAEQRPDVVAALEEVMERGSTVVGLDLRTADGDRIPYEFTGSRLTDADGSPTGLVGVGRDVSDR